jgi:hypothetical protein
LPTDHTFTGQKQNRPACSGSVVFYQPERMRYCNIASTARVVSVSSSPSTSRCEITSNV